MSNVNSFETRTEKLRARETRTTPSKDQSVRSRLMVTWNAKNQIMRPGPGIPDLA